MSDQPTTTEPPEQYETEDVAEQSSGNAGIQSASTEPKTLLIKDCNPWTTRANERVLGDLQTRLDILNSSSLADANLEQYTAVVLPSTQNETYYRRLRNNSDAIDSFVSNGGTLVAHVTDGGWPCSTSTSMSFLPRGVATVKQSSDTLDRIETNHPVVAGIDDGDLDYWNASAHGYLTDLPADATEVIGIHGDDGRTTYAEYDHGDGRVLVNTQTIEWPWFAGYGTKRLLRNELGHALSDQRSAEPSSVSASVTTLQFIPGKSENPSEGGHPLNSGLMHIFPANDSFSLWGVDVELGTEPVFDNWLGGDMIEELPADLEAAREKESRKYLDDVGDVPFREYRFENGVSVSFDTDSDGGIDRETIEIEFSEMGPSGNDDIVVRGNQENSKTVLHDHPLNGIPFQDWYGENVRRSNRKRRYYRYDTDFEFDGVEGVRVLTVWGGYAGFVADISRRASEDPGDFINQVWNWDVGAWIAKLAVANGPDEFQFLLDMLTTVPNTYSFIDFIVLADGRRYARVWDASQYPSLFTYVDGSLEQAEKMPYRSKELWNLKMTAFYLWAIRGATPYESIGDRTWERLVRTSGKIPAKREIDRMLDLIPPDWDVTDIIPTVPRVTVGFESANHTEPISNPSKPFPQPEDLVFPWNESLPPN